QCNAPPLITLKPCSIHARNAYQHGDAAQAGKSVSTSQGSSYSALQKASSVHANGCLAVLQARPVAANPAPTRRTSPPTLSQRTEPAGRNLPAALTRSSGCQPTATMAVNKAADSKPRSLSTTTVQSAGTPGAKVRNSWHQCGCQASF